MSLRVDAAADLETAAATTGTVLPPTRASADDEPAVEIALHERPVFRVHHRWWRPAPGAPARRPGLWWHGVRRVGRAGDPEPVDVRVCNPAWKLATCEFDGEGTFGLLLEFVDLRGRVRRVVVERADLVGDGTAAIRALEAAGIGSEDDRRLLEWLRPAPPERTVRAVRRTGWTSDFTVFVLPEGPIGMEASVFAPGNRWVGTAGYGRGGEPTGWREAAALAEGNPVMVLSVCAAFAAPLLGPIGLVGGGLHLVGASGVGKTTAVLLAAAAWGRGVETGGYMRTWSGTANGIEALAAERSDTLLVLDEFGATPGDEIEALIYRLCGGVGRSRASRDGSARPAATWRTFLLSTGEVGLEARLRRPLHPGAKGRLLELRLDEGIVRVRHGFGSDRELAARVRRLVAEHYGHAGPAFVHRLLQAGLEGLRRRFGHERGAFGATTPVEERAANTFALLALAGELAIEYGILPWTAGTARTAAMGAWALWRERVAPEADETRRAAEALLEFVERHGESRFSEASTHEDRRERAGWWRTGREGGREWLFTSAALKEALDGLERERACRLLEEAGVLVRPERGSRRSHSLRVDGRQVRVYVVREAALHAVVAGRDGSTADAASAVARAADPVGEGDGWEPIG